MQEKLQELREGCETKSGVKMDKTKLQSAISVFIKNKKANAAYNSDNWAERKERKAYYQSFTKAKLLAMTESAFSSI